MTQKLQTPADIVRRTRKAAEGLRTASHNQRVRILEAVADGLDGRVEEILAANRQDLEAAADAQLSEAVLDRLRLDADRTGDMSQAVRDVAALDDPLQEVLLDRTLDNGLRIRQVRVPFGLVCVVYEARPNVTSDAAAIAIKTGNGILLRGSTHALHTNTAVASIIQTALEDHGIAPDAVTLYDPLDKQGFKDVIAMEDEIDVIIPRGGEGLKRFLYEHARVPILAAAGGNCHVYVDRDADLEMARAIVLNAKTQRTGVCNAAETLLIHEDAADGMYGPLTDMLTEAGVTIHEEAESFGTEFLDMDISVHVVSSLEDAIEHINTYGTRHSEAIITENADAARRFMEGVDAACVYHNASTRFTDGGVFGLGAEVGISTNKLHARGPIGLVELTTTQYRISGSGQVRQ